MQYKFIGVPSFTGPKPAKYTSPASAAPRLRRPRRRSKSASRWCKTRLAKQDEAFRRRYTESFDMSWIYHDSALEGVVYSFPGAEDRPRLERDGRAGLQPAAGLRRNPPAQAGHRVRPRLRHKKRLPVTLDVVKRIYLILHPEEGDIKTLKYRKDIPQHRLYFHEYAPPDKIAYKVRQMRRLDQRSRDQARPQCAAHRRPRALRSCCASFPSRTTAARSLAC